MPTRNARDLVLHVGDGRTPLLDGAGSAPESFAPVTAARRAALTVGNRPAEATPFGAAVVRQWAAGAAAQDMQVRIEGAVRGQPSEELLRAAAFSGVAVNCRLVFPGGDSYAAAFIVRDYERGGVSDGREEFSVTLQRAGDGVYTSRGVS